MTQQSTHRRGKPCVTCRDCGLTFIGRGAVREWSEHTWTHFDESWRP